jgi:DNA-binding IclR family transcriptional regulator
MATTKNNYADSCNFGSKGKLLLDEFISVSSNTEHMSMSDNDRLIYVHEKSRRYNMCKIPVGTNWGNNKKCLRQKVLPKMEVTGGKSRVC